MESFTTERLLIRPLCLADLEDIHLLNSLTSVAKYNTIGIPKDIDVTKNLLEIDLLDDRRKRWVILKKGGDVFLGAMGMNVSPERYKKGEIHYSLLPEFWGRGYAQEAVRALISYGFKVLDLHRIEAGVAVENTRSVTLLEKLRMRREGTCRKILPLASGWMDNYMYAILDSDARDY